MYRIVKESNENYVFKNFRKQTQSMKEQYPREHIRSEINYELNGKKEKKTFEPCT